MEESLYIIKEYHIIKRTEAFMKYKTILIVPVLELIIPLRIRKSIVTGQLVVFISGRHKREGS